MKLISEKKFSRLQYITFKNVLRLLFDSNILFQRKSYPSAFALAILAQEELGKVFIVDDIIYHDNLRELDKESLSWYIKDFHYHSTKQWRAISFRYEHSKRGLKLHRRIFNKEIESMKQSALYVGLTNKDVKGKITSPLNITKNKTIKQIHFITEVIVHIIKWKIGQTSFFDGLYIDNLLNRKLLIKLQKLLTSTS